MGVTNNQVDRQIRLLDQSIEEVETIIALASHPDSQPRRILSYTVTGRWLRPQIEPLPQPSDRLSGTHEPPTIEFPVSDRSHGRAETTTVRRTKKGKKRKNVHGQHASQPPEISAVGDVAVHTPDPNEPRYCYCNNVSYGAVRVVSLSSVSKAYGISQMVQCENGVKCPFDWVSFRVVARSYLTCLSSFITIASDSRRRQKGSGSVPLANQGGRGSVARPIRSFNTFPVGPLSPLPACWT